MPLSFVNGLMNTRLVTPAGMSLIVLAAFMLTALVVYANYSNKQNQYKFNNIISSIKIENKINPIEVNMLEKRLLNLDGVYKAVYNRKTNMMIFIYDPTIQRLSKIHDEINYSKASITLNTKTTEIKICNKYFTF